MTVSEIRTSEVIKEQSKKQLEVSYKQAEELDVDYVLVPQERVAYIVKREYFMSAILDELEYRKEE